MAHPMLRLRARIRSERRRAWKLGLGTASLGTAGAVIASFGGSAVGHRDARGFGPTRGAAASCVGLTPAQQFTNARIVVEGTMLRGRTLPVGSRQVLASPARMRVSRYMKGTGPRLVRVQTGVSVSRGGAAVSEDGIEPRPGERWRIYSSSSRQPFATSICAGSRQLRPAGQKVRSFKHSGPRPESLPLPPGAAWYSEALDTSAPTVANGLPRSGTHLLLQKWVTWQGNEFQKDSAPGLRLGPGGYMTGDSEPGFGDWDALNVHTLPGTAAGVMRLLKSGRLEAGQTDRAEQHTPLIWLAQLAAMLADDPNTAASRAAAFKAIYSFPGLLRLGRVRDPRGRTGIAVAERAADLHPLLVATGPGCRSPYGGAGCLGVGRPSGSYQLEMIFDPSSHAVLAVRTVALSAIPAASIKSGTVMREVSYLQGKVVLRPRIPPFPRALRPTVESVLWHQLP